ncbi:epoxyqueuosine reductase [Lawsonibacter celer]|uniref:epoxyqueuosine reductase n=1 Tax=Lawsonibacter celer TaxID=2986526 RepID=UPI0016457FA7|nr:QueG-associated DUF1730 domain-containing protein [Lawsonibacter celer]
MIPGLDAAFAAAGAAGWGAVAYGRLAPAMSPAARERAEEACPCPAAVLVAAFPYYAGNRPGNLSLYARGRDYHAVVTARLNTVCSFLKEHYPGYLFLPAADNSPLPEREAARLAGLGMMGWNGLVILPPYGTYLFLGTILTDAPLPVEEVPPSPDCPGCGRCVSACPGGALGPDGFALERCLSHLTQKKGELTEKENALVAAHPLVWGCDFCQRVCPFNDHPALSPLPEFTCGLVARVAPEDLEGLTNRAFQEKYGAYAFAWRGPAVLRRNLELQKKKE